MQTESATQSVTASANSANAVTPLPAVTPANLDAGRGGPLPGTILAAPASASVVASASQPETQQPNSPSSPAAEPKPAVASSPEPADAPSTALNHARLLQTVNGSQMQVNLSTEEFGRISVHAGYSREAVTAQITLENSQLGSAISAHLPGAEQKLAGDHGLRTSISVATATANGSQSDSRSGSDQRNNTPYSGQRNGSLSRSSLDSTDAGLPFVPSSSASSTQAQATSGRLNVTI